MRCLRATLGPGPPEEGLDHPGGLGADLLLPQFRCPACEAAGATVVRGDELEVESIDVDDEAAPGEPVAARARMSS